MSDKQILNNIVKWLDHDIMLCQESIYQQGNQPVTIDGSDEFFKGNLYTSTNLSTQIKEWKQEESK